MGSINNVSDTAGHSIDGRRHQLTGRWSREAIEIVVWLVLVTSGVFLRQAFDSVPNFAPVAGLALFSGFFFRSLWRAISVPVAVMAISDAFFQSSGYSLAVMTVVYLSLAAPVFFRSLLRRATSSKNRPLIKWVWTSMSVLGGAIAASLFFFIVTNFAVWIVWHHGNWADFTFCYIRALPFLRHTLGGDLLFTSVYFGSYAAILGVLSHAAKRRGSAAVTSIG